MLWYTQWTSLLLTTMNFSSSATLFRDRDPYSWDFKELPFLVRTYRSFTLFVICFRSFHCLVIRAALHTWVFNHLGRSLNTKIVLLIKVFICSRNDVTIDRFVMKSLSILSTLSKFCQTWMKWRAPIFDIFPLICMQNVCEASRFI